MKSLKVKKTDPFSTHFSLLLTNPRKINLRPFRALNGLLRINFKIKRAVISISGTFPSARLSKSTLKENKQKKKHKHFFLFRLLWWDKISVWDVLFMRNRRGKRQMSRMQLTTVLYTTNIVGIDFNPVSFSLLCPLSFLYIFFNPIYSYFQTLHMEDRFLVHFCISLARLQ